MAKFELKFICSHAANEKDFIKAIYEQKDEQYKKDSILIHSQMDGEDSYIFLDKSTAIKFAKTLRTEINKISE